ncbi:MAG: hypothetical protein A2284_08555 [Deltaproteobacteria bacterium RIFOXYA12_FULL_61_11]|nr:MAG: hypothetical protein A2284_08555 [Deltaproteobacteria bacterium RIFOXYA12_FULL_61_11]
MRIIARTILLVLAFAPQRLYLPTPKTVTIGCLGSFDHLDPRDEDHGWAAMVAELVYEGFYRLDKHYRVVPALLESAQSDGAGRTVLTLRPDAHFHDGSPVRAADAAATIDAYRRGDYLVSLASLRFGQVEVIDERTLAVELSPPLPEAALDLTMLGILPRHLLVDGDRELRAAPPGTGPFRVVSATEASILLVRNPLYYGRLPRLDRVLLTSLPDETRIFTALIRGDLEYYPALSAGAAARLSTLPSCKVVQVFLPATVMVALNNRVPFFAAPLVRRALDLGVDKAGILAAIAPGEAYLADSLLSPAHPHYRPGPVRTYDPAAARTLLIEAGAIRRNEGLYVGDCRLGVLLDRSQEQTPDLAAAMRYLGNDLLNLGFAVRDRGVTLDPKDAACTAEATLLNVPSFPAAGTDWLNLLFDHDLIGYANREALSLFRFLRASVPDTPDLAAAYQRLQEVLREDPPGIVLYWRTGHLAHHVRLIGPDPGERPFFGLPDWDVVSR